MIFDEATLRKLNRLSLAASKIRAGVVKGERRSTRRGSSVEFADYRDYAPGDDLRRLDWNVYARLEKPFIKLLEEEEDLAVHVLIDASRSMDWGEAGEHKLSYALRLAGAIGVIALSAGDQLTLGVMQNHPGAAPLALGPLRSQVNVPRAMAFLETVKSGGETDLNSRLIEYAVLARRPGLAFLISDLFSPQGYQAGLAQLENRGYEIVILHILHPDELDPPFAGDLRLLDSETGTAQEASVDGQMRASYRQAVLDWQESHRAYCNKRGMRYLPLLTSTLWDKFVLYQMRKEGLVK